MREVALLCPPLQGNKSVFASCEDKNAWNLLFNTAAMKGPRRPWLCVGANRDGDKGRVASAEERKSVQSHRHAFGGLRECWYK